MASIVDPDGRQLRVVARYIDGIVGSDPVTISVRAANDVIVAKLEQSRDALVQCPSFESCRVFLYAPPFKLLPERIVRFTPAGFVDERATRYVVIGAVLPIWRHFGQLVFESFALAIVPMIIQALLRRRRTKLLIAAWALFVPVAFAWLFVLFLGVSLNSRVSVSWVGLGVALLTGLPLLIRAALRQRSLAN